MKKRFKTIVIVAVVALIAIIIALNITNKPTGQATLTPGANYGPISTDRGLYVNCVYLTDDDGWDVLTVGKVQYFDKTTGVIKEIEDNCDVDRTIREYHCDKSGYRIMRVVNCPSGMICDQGKCISE